MTDDYQFTDAYQDISDIAQSVIDECAETQGVEDVEVVPIQAIDEAEMPRALENPDDLSQSEWDDLRRRIVAEVQSLGPYVD